MRVGGSGQQAFFGRLGLGKVLAMTAAVSIAAGFGVAGGGSVAAAAPVCGTFQLQSVPQIVGTSSVGSVLSAVARVGSAETWAVGNYNDPSVGASRTLAEHFAGGSWSAVSTPNASSLNNGLNDLAMRAGGGWAVGYALHPGVPGGRGPAYQPLVLRWDGAGWARQSVPSPDTTTDAILSGIVGLSSTEAWGVGYRTATNGVRRSLIYHEASGVWSQTASPNDGALNVEDNVLLAVAGSTSTGQWAVGYRQSSTGYRPLILRHTGTGGWTSVSGSQQVPSPGRVDTVLTGVAVRSAVDVWAVGYLDHGAGHQPLAMHFDGVAWTASTLPGIGPLRDVKVSGTSDVWAVGTAYSVVEHRLVTLMLRFDGSSWSTAVSANAPLPADNELLGVAVDAQGTMVTAVGSTGAKPLAELAVCSTGPVSPATRLPPAAGAAPLAPGVGAAPPLPPPPTPSVAPVSVQVSDQARAAGIYDGLLPSWSAAIGDFASATGPAAKSDSWVDLFIGHHGQPGRMWKSKRDGTFSEILAGVFGGLDRHDCVPGDVNVDGLLDMFCSVGADRGSGLKHNALYLQGRTNGSVSFSDRAFAWHVTDPTGRGRRSAVFDANNDGFPDVFSGSAATRPDGLPAPNRLFLNTRRGSFLDSPGYHLNQNVGAGCAHVVDENADGWPDLLVCGRTDTTPTGLHLYRNDRGRGFIEITNAVGLISTDARRAEDAAMADVNSDGRADLITLTLTRVAVQLQRQTGEFAAASFSLGSLKGGRALAVGDVNADHRPDVYVVTSRATTSTGNEPDLMLVGLAGGGFSRTPIPQTTAGSGDVAYALDYNHDSLTDFLVLNGLNQFAGPVQLIRFTRAASVTPKLSSVGRLTFGRGRPHNSAR